MDERFFVYIDRLREGCSEHWEFDADSSILDVNEPELRFSGKVSLSGEAQLSSLGSEKELFLSLELEAQAHMPCAICNGDVCIDVKPERSHTTVPLTEVKGAVFDWSPFARETALLGVPQFVECQGGCPERAKIAPFLKQPDREKVDKGQTYHPFADLSLEIEE